MVGVVLFVVACVSGLHALLCLWVRSRVPALEDLEEVGGDDLPSVSVVIAARDEAAHVEAALRAWAAVDYPNLEVVIVDDRSTDGTTEIVDRLAAESDRITAVHVTELPERWLGKVHAMHVGIQASRGEWVLLSDGDVYVAPGTLRRVVGYAEAEDLDHVAALPTVWRKGWLFDAVLASFVRLVAFASLTTPVGCGAFNMFRRRAYDRSPGMEALRMEVGDDVELARLLVRSGARTKWFNGRRVLGLEFYPSLEVMGRSMEKVAGVRGGHPVALLFGAVLFWLLEAAPFLCLWFDAWRLPALAICGLVLTTSVVMNRWVAQPAWPALLAPFTAVVGAVFLVRAAVLALVRGGIYWRGTFYPNRSLRSATASSATRSHKGRPSSRSCPPDNGTLPRRVSTPFPGRTTRPVGSPPPHGSAPPSHP